MTQPSREKLKLIPLTSARNEHIKGLLLLRDKSALRREQRQFFVEGLREVTQAQQSQQIILELYVLESSLQEVEIQNLLMECWKKNQNILTFSLAEGLFDKISLRGRSAKVVAVARETKLTLEQLTLPKLNPFILICDGIEKPGNLGAMFRTADAFGVDAILLCGSTVDAYNPHVIRASLGAVFSVPWLSLTTEGVLALSREKKIPLMGAVLAKDSKSMTQVPMKGPLGIVLGSEAWGISPEIKAHLSTQIMIPMQGQVDSLNVSVAAAIFIYEAWRQRNESL